MDFLKLVQKKEQKSDNKIIAGTVFLVVLIMSAIVFWPTKSEHHLLNYLPEQASFYIHWSNKKYFSKDSIVAGQQSNQEIEHLKEVLGSNFFNLQEVLWFKTAQDFEHNNYLLRFSRLPRSFVTDLAEMYPDFSILKLEKNIALISTGQGIENLENNHLAEAKWQDGMTFYWQKNQVPDFLSVESQMIDQIFLGNDILLNWQVLDNEKNRLNFIEQGNKDTKDVKSFMSPNDFDLFLSFQTSLADDLSDEIIDNVLLNLFDDLPYYNLDKQVIKNRLVQDAVLWRRGDSWLLASTQTFAGDIVDFIKLFKVEEVNKVLEDGTAYTELLASSDQPALEHNINGQKILQIDELWLWDIGNQYYLSNDLAIIEELTANNYHLYDVLTACDLDMDYKVGDILYLNKDKIEFGAIEEYLASHNIGNIQAFSYVKEGVSGLNICF